MDASTRPPQISHRSASKLAAALVAILLSTSHLSFATTTEHSPAPDILISTAPSTHDISISTVKSGEEGLELSARFTELAHDFVSDVSWTIRDASGEKVFDGITAQADANLPPGDYLITARYGSAQITQGATVHQGTKLSINFILNAGGLRILPRIKNFSSQPLPSVAKIFAATGPLRGQLIATSNTPGEIIKISAGDYRIESRFGNGNALAVTDVKVNAGRMSAINIDHKAGVARLNYLGSNSQDVQWILRDENGQVLPTLFGPEADIVLKAGRYHIEVIAPEQTLSTEQDITIGETSVINLGY